MSRSLSDYLHLGNGVGHVVLRHVVCGQSPESSKAISVPGFSRVSSDSSRSPRFCSRRDD
jgi:hypothetical protein